MDKLEKLKFKFNRRILQHDWQDALLIIDKMIALQPTAHHYYKRGGVFLKLNKYEEGVRNLKKALEIDSTHREAKEILARLDSKTEEHAQAANDKIVVQMDRTQVAWASMVTTDVTSVEELLEPEPEVVKTAFLSRDKFLPLTRDNNYFGRYRIIAEIGRGGMGQVYKAFDTELDRIVALKILLVKDILQGQDIQRFLREAQATAKLKHPNIVAVHDTGSHEGHNYFTMDFVEGVSLQEFIQRSAPALSQIVSIMIQVANAIHYAHEQGIVHRDLKPANIMIDEHWQPKIMDFGLAKIIGADSTRSSAHMGTPAYMSPEQADFKHVDKRADVYAAGATLYECLTGRPPFQGESYFNILYQILRNDPVTPRMLNPDIPFDLEAICLKCLEKKPDKRYATMQLLERDLQNFRDHRPVDARPAKTVTHMRRFVRRNKPLMAATIAISSVLLLFALFALREWRRAVVQKRTIWNKYREQLHNYRTATIKLAKIALAKAQEASIRGNWRQCGALAGTGLELLKPFPEHKELQYRGKVAIKAALYGDGLLWETESSGTCQLAYSADGKILASAVEDKIIGLWDVATGKQIQALFGHNATVNTVTFSPNAAILASASSDNDIILWNIDLGKRIKTLRAHSQPVYSLAFSSDGRILASASKDKTVRLWDMMGEQHGVLPHSGTVNYITFSPDGSMLASTSVDTTVRIWDTAGKKQIAMLNGHFLPISSVAFSPDSKKLASASWDKAIKLWDIATGKPIQTFVGHSDAVNAVAFSPDGQIIASGSSDTSVRLWDAEGGQQLRRFTGHCKPVYSLAFSPDGKTLASTCSGRTLRLWNVAGSAHTHIFNNSQVANVLTFSPDNKLLAAATGAIIKIWDLKKRRRVHECKGHYQPVYLLMFSPDGSMLASAAQDQSVRLWAMATGKQIRQFAVDKQTLGALAFNARGTNLLFASPNKVVTIWNVHNGHKLQQIDLGRDADVISAIAFSPDKAILAYASWNKSIIVWDIAANQQLKVLDGHTQTVNSLAFSQNGALLASASQDETIRLWSIASGDILTTLRGHRDSVTAIAFSPDNKTLASVSADQTLRLWDVDTGIQVQQWRRSLVSTLAVSHNGRMLATATQDKKVQLWDIAPRMSNANIPAWAKQFVEVDSYLPLHMEFNYRYDVSGALISQTLASHPQLLAHALFGLRVTDTLTMVAHPLASPKLRKGSVVAATNARQYWQRGLQFYAQKQLLAAVDHIQLALTMDIERILPLLQNQAQQLCPTLAELYFRRAQNRSRLLALKNYSIAIRIQPTFAQAYFQRGLLYYQLQNFQTAADDFYQACKLQPKNQEFLKQWWQVKSMLKGGDSKFER